MTIKKTIRIATRKSPLALWQANHVKDKLEKIWPNIDIELLPMVTSGDKFLKDKLLAAGGKGLFVKELEEALLDKRADLAVHSTKDMPAQLPSGLNLAAICARESPFDALVSPQFTALDDLPHGAVVGTASLRRQSQLLAYRPDLQIKTLRGNVQTRLAKLAAQEYDAIILAAAGLERMGLHAKITQELSPEIMLPACGQGALCIECRSDDQDIQELITPLNDPLSALCVTTERQVNAQLGGNCHLPLAVFCTLSDTRELFLRTRLLSTDGKTVLFSSDKAQQEDAIALAAHCTQSLIDQGAASLISITQ